MDAITERQMFLERFYSMLSIYKLSGRSLLIIGWTIFLISLFLPSSLSNGGLTDAGKSFLGFINLFYSFIAIGVVFEGLHSQNKKETFDILSHAILGLLNLIMIFVPALLLLSGKSVLWAQRIMFVGALYVCTIGFVVMRHWQLRYGHFVWCLSFIIVAVALSIETKRYQ